MESVSEIGLPMRQELEDPKERAHVWVLRSKAEYTALGAWI